MVASTAIGSNLRDPALVQGFTNLRESREQEPLRIVRGQGIFIFDDKGKDYIEGVSSFYCTSLGFNEEALVEAAAEQMRALPFYVSAAHRCVPVVEQLAEKLSALVPMDNAKVAFAATGSEANDALIKFLWFHNNAVGKNRRKKVVARLGSYHGGTIATASLTGWPKYHTGFDLPIAGILHTPQPNFAQDAEAGESEELFADRMVAALRKLIEKEDPETIGAFIAEPVSVSAGLAVPPRTYWDKITALLREYDIRFFADEVVTGFGRTGNLWGCETWDMVPDCMTVAKALSSAYLPISAVIMADEFYQGLELGSEEAGMFSHAGTYHGHPVSAAVALRVLEIMESRNIVGHVRDVMPHFQTLLQACQDHPLVSATRAIGLAGAVDLGFAMSLPPGALGSAFATRCQDHGLFVRPTTDTAVLAPPLIITTAEIDEMFRRLQAALDATLDWAHQQANA